MDMEREIDVTIVVLTYFHEKYIAQALDSILAQKTDLHYEILVGDDASEDRTPEILREYEARDPEHIKLTLRPENVGATRNGTDLYQRARGKYIANLEGDDFWLDPHKLQKQWEFLETHPEYVGCCGKCIIVDENGIPDYTQTPQFVQCSKTMTLEEFVADWRLPSQAGTFMYRNIYRDMDPGEYAIRDTAHRNVGDKTIMLLLLPHGPFYCSNEILSAYRFVKSGGHNHFSRHYANPYRHYDMFMYPCRLETWARKTLGLKAHLGKQKDNRFRHFIEETVKDPSLVRMKYILDMIVHGHQPVKYMGLALKTLIELED